MHVHLNAVALLDIKIPEGAMEEEGSSIDHEAGGTDDEGGDIVGDPEGVGSYDSGSRSPMESRWANLLTPLAALPALRMVYVDKKQLEPLQLVGAVRRLAEARPDVDVEGIDNSGDGGFAILGALFGALLPGPADAKPCSIL